MSIIDKIKNLFVKESVEIDYEDFKKVLQVRLELALKEEEIDKQARLELESYLVEMTNK